LESLSQEQPAALQVAGGEALTRIVSRVCLHLYSYRASREVAVDDLCCTSGDAKSDPICEQHVESKEGAGLSSLLCWISRHVGRDEIASRTSMPPVNQVQMPVRTHVECERLEAPLAWSERS